MKNKFGKIAIVDDDQSILDTLTSIISKQYEVFSCRNKNEFLHILETEVIDVVFLDILLGNDNGLEILETIKEKIPEIEVIMMSVLREPDTVVKAIKFGAFDYLTKEFHPDEVLFKANRAFKSKDLRRDLKVIELEKQNLSSNSYVAANELEIGPVFNKLFDLVSKSDFVIISGEFGAGKKTLAREIASKMGFDRPMIVFSPTDANYNDLLFTQPNILSPYGDSLIELGHNGLLFIDGLNNTNREFQEKLSAFLRNKHYIKNGRSVSSNVKIVASVTENPNDLEEVSKIIPELLDHAAKTPIIIQPIRKRKRDIEIISKFFLKHYSRYYNKKISFLSDDVLEFFKNYSWNCNICELKNVIESLVIHNEDGTIYMEDVCLKYFIPPSHKLRFMKLERINIKQKLKEFEKDTFVKTLRAFYWNKKKTAEYLSMPYSTLKVRINKLKINKDNS